jgi:hypothetical protein
VLGTGVTPCTSPVGELLVVGCRAASGTVTAACVEESVCSAEGDVGPWPVGNVSMRKAESSSKTSRAARSDADSFGDSQLGSGQGSYTGAGPVGRLLGSEPHATRLDRAIGAHNAVNTEKRIGSGVYNRIPPGRKPRKTPA